MTDAQATQIINRCLKGLQEQIAWAQHDLSAIGYRVPPETANEFHAIGSALIYTALDLEGMGEEE
jgi:hypothetical protein